MMEKRYLGIDVGGTYIKMGFVSGSGEVSMFRRLPVDRSGREHVMDTIMRGAEALLAEAGIEASELSGIGVSAAGCINTAEGSVSDNGGNVPDWPFTKVTGPLEEKFGVPATLANDGNCVALAEAWIGEAAGCSDVICIVLGTGVGGGIISGGHLIEGSHGYAGEIGHFPTHVGVVPKFRGDTGCHYENYASTAALVRSASKVDPLWENGHDVFVAAAEGNKAALEVIDTWIDEVAFGIMGFVHTFNPKMVLIGGGVSVQEDLLIAPLREKVLSLIFPDFAEDLEIEAAALGNDAGVVGAVRYFMNTKGRGI